MIKLRQSSMNKAIAKLKKLGSAANYGAHEGVGQQGKRLLATVKQNMSLTDHSLDDLRKMGHPYARKRHSSIAIHQGTSSTLADTTNYVHKQSGELLRALKGEKKTNQIRYRVSVDPNAAKNESGKPYAKFVLETDGTKIMFGRPLLAATANTPQVQSELKDGVLRSIAKAIAKV